jgi:secreted trypsin-like serine protease
MIQYLFIMLLFANLLFSTQLRIINGTQVLQSDEQWRAIVSLRYNTEHYCGGSLIAPTWVLTAAHCILAYAPTTIGVGNYSLSSISPYSIKHSIVHPNYNSFTIDNDIALIELNTAVTDIKVITLDKNSTLAPDTTTWTAGWGDTDIDPNQVFNPSSLMEVLVPLVDFNTCNQAYHNILTDNMICAGYMSGFYDSCQGDSGGPLAVEENGNTVQMGIVSSGGDCAAANSPGIYTKVQNYIDWIEDHTGTLPHNQTPAKSNILPAVLMYLLH